MALRRYSQIQVKDGRETIFIRDAGHPRGLFQDLIRKYANAFFNSHGGVLYLGVAPNGSVIGSKINRKEEDDYRLSVDHTIGSFQPFIAANLYRLTFIPIEIDSRPSDYKVIELKVSVGSIGEIYENGMSGVFIIDEGNLIGPLFPQELKELILLKYKENIEGAEEARKFTTPNLQAARASARKKERPKEMKNLGTITEEGEIISPEKSKPLNQVDTNRDTIIKPWHGEGRATVYYDDDFF